MKILNNMKSNLKDIAELISREFRTIATSYSILLVLIGGIFIYGLLYNYMYQPNVIRNAPVVVVDKSNSSLSREYTRLIDAAPQVTVYSNEVDFIAAKELMKRNEVVGIVYIPKDFDTRVKRGEESIFITYGVTEAFLYYSALQEASSGAMLELDGRHRADMVVFLPANDVQQIAQSSPITISENILYNHTEGYGNYLIPAVLMVIIFQTLFMVIGMISGKERESRSIRLFAEKGTSLSRVSRIIISKTFVYCILYAVFCLFLLGLLPVIFDLPNLGNVYEIVMLLTPYLLSISFLGLSASIFFTDSETPILMIAFFSVGLVFLSGISYPLELMPWYWQAAHYVIPAAPGTLAFVKLNCMGASLADIQTEYITLWIQCGVYFILACLTYQYNIKKAIRSTDLIKNANHDYNN
ncbi:ABC transporter permease [Dysgonomonas sp. HGC4]|uniref:ABC transporter permease n=1 Tax=Dysgonomonas sp. HGC4 TaxID=1658009 RepID=UPI000681DB4F|nr:ABC transporter permease [Dysgonomonas sp. HGC4]MBD8347286.1 ABC transporter permease [Dysgonomonas sp. HGC4]